MELIAYLQIIRRWLWLIILVAVVGASLNIYRNLDDEPIYTAEARVLVGRYANDPDPSSNEIGIARDLLQIYVELSKQRELLDTLRDEYELDMSMGEMRRNITTSVVEGTTLLNIRVRHPDNETAAQIANGLSQQLIIRSPSTLTEEQLARIELAEDQINGLRQNQQQIQREIDDLDIQLETALRTEFEQINQRRLLLIAQYNELSNSISGFASLITSLEDPVNSISVFEAADIPGTADVPNRIADGLVGGIGGAVIVIAILLLLEFFNTNVRTRRQVEKDLQLPVLGAISNYQPRFRRGGGPRLIGSAHDPLLLEEFRTLRTSFNAILSSTEHRNIVVTSTFGTEGKSIIAANLAIILARSGRRVCLVDADMRQPKQHKLFGLKMQPGMADLLGGGHLDGTQAEPLPTDAYASLPQATEIARLSVIPAGYIATDANEILNGVPIKQFKNWLETESDFEVVIFDTPPTLPVTDGGILAASMGAAVLFNIRFDYVSIDDAKLALDRFSQLNVPVMGAVLNRVRRERTRQNKGLNVKRYLQGNAAIPGQVK